jgi:hypothetical protein
MRSDVPGSLDELPADVPVPADAVCVFVSGSLVAGWGHTHSDVDLYVVSETPAPVTPTALLELRLSTTPLPVLTIHEDSGRRWDVEYWTIAQIDELLAAVAERDEGPTATVGRLGYADVDCFYRLSIGVALSGADWLAEAKRRVAGSALSRLLAAREFDEADGFIEDAAGLVDVGDGHSAVLAAHRALGHAVDGYLASQGSLSPSPKWRYRKLAELAGSALEPAVYWRLETMRDLDPDDPAPWVEQVAETCQALILEVDFA